MSDPQTPIVVVSKLGDAGVDFLDTLRSCLAILASNSGCMGIELGRSMDSESEFVLVSRWDNVGSYRKALSNYQVKSEVIPFISMHTKDSFTGEVIETGNVSGSESFPSALAEDAFTYERGNT